MAACQLRIGAARYLWSPHTILFLLAQQQKISCSTACFESGPPVCVHARKRLASSEMQALEINKLGLETTLVQRWFLRHLDQDIITFHLNWKGPNGGDSGEAQHAPIADIEAGAMTRADNLITI